MTKSLRLIQNEGSNFGIPSGSTPITKGQNNGYIVFETPSETPGPGPRLIPNEPPGPGLIRSEYRPDSCMYALVDTGIDDNN